MANQSGNKEIPCILGPSSIEIHKSINKLIISTVLDISKMELVPEKLFFAAEKVWRGSPKRFPPKSISLDCLYQLNESRSFGVPSIQSILFHCSEVDRRLKQYGSIVYTTNDKKDPSSIKSKTCSALFMGAYAVLRLGWSTKYTMRTITENIKGPLANFLDHHGSQNYGLTVEDCLEALDVGVNKLGWFKDDVICRFNKGIDMSWVIPNKVIAMRDPSITANGGKGETDMECHKAELKSKSIDLILRLNKLDFKDNPKRGVPYDSSEFKKEGFRHEDIPFKDCGIPSAGQVCRFLELVSKSATKVAVHCHAGLGRTGTMIACHVIYNYDFTSRQAVGWLNLCRRGSIMGKQHKFLDDFFNIVSSLKANRPFCGIMSQPLINMNILKKRLEGSQMNAKDKLLSNVTCMQQNNRFKQTRLNSFEEPLVSRKYQGNQLRNSNQNRQTVNFKKIQTKTVNHIDREPSYIRGDLAKGVMNDVIDLMANIEAGDQRKRDFQVADPVPTTIPIFASLWTGKLYQNGQLPSKEESDDQLMPSIFNGETTDVIKSEETSPQRKPSSRKKQHSAADNSQFYDLCRRRTIEEQIADISGSLKRRIAGLFTIINCDFNSFKYKVD